MITFTLMSLVTSVKDYVEITHKLISTSPLTNYTDFGAVFTYFIFSIGDFLKNFLSFSFLKNLWSIPIIIPDIASAMISEVSVIDGYFHNAFTVLETSVFTNPGLSIFEKFIIGLINSFFLFLPTSTSHLITLRRFVMQGLEAGYMAGLGTLAGNFLWLASIILGWRFFVIPWLSLDIFRYLLGFILLVKYIWDSSKERRIALEDLSKWKIFLLNFLLALTEQSCIYPFISNISIGPDVSVLEGFPVENYMQFLSIHGAYLFGILLGSFSLLQFTCWFWENPAFSIYLWVTTKSSLKITTSSYYKILNFMFLYCTMLCAIASIPYYGLDYTITNPIGLVPQDRILDQKISQSDPNKLITETAFLGVNPTDKNLRIRDGVHARRERWKQRLIKYQAYDASVYDQGVYDFLTIEDLNYGFDRFWLRRKMRNHQIRFRLFPGPWMRSLKKQLNNPKNNNANAYHNSQSLENSNKAATGPRVEFFRILFEQFYHPNFHDRNKIKTSYNSNLKNNKSKIISSISEKSRLTTSSASYTTNNETLNQLNINSENIIKKINKVSQINYNVKQIINNKNEINTNSALRKFVRNFNTRMSLNLIKNHKNTLINKYNNQFIYSKRWKSIFSKIQPKTKTKNNKSYRLFRNVSQQLLLTPEAKSLKLANINQKLSTKERKILNLKLFCTNTKKNKKTDNINLSNNEKMNFQKIMLLRPLNIYLQKEQAFKRKLRYYGTIPMRKLTIGNQAPYFKALMKRGFYYYKPSLRLKKTLYVAKNIRGFRKKSRKQQVLVMQNNLQNLGFLSSTQKNEKVYTSQKLNQNTEEYIKIFNSSQINQKITKPTHSYSVLGKRASRYRHQIYKDVLQHWYYTPFNRLLLKFDVDSFIKRQPKTHFLTKNEERLLHIRRFLLSEHYDTLRWYTYMQHYQTMKTHIGGTKSFATRTYNQQFQGTFKKIRHLFAITPKQGDLYTLKFDQPLYNDNKLKDNVYFHEELLIDNNLNQESELNNLQNVPQEQNKEGINFFAQVNKNYNSQNFYEKNKKETNIINDSFNADLMNQSSYLIGNNFLNSSGSIRPLNITEMLMLEPSKTDKNLNLIISPNEKIKMVRVQNLDFVYSELFVKLIKECKKRVHNQAFLKNYITHRIEKREQLNQEQTKELTKRLEKLKIWLNTEQKISQSTTSKEINTILDNTILTTGMQKAINDSLSFSENPIKTLKLKTTYNELKTAYTIKTEEQILTKLNVINKVKSVDNKNKNIILIKLAKTKQFILNTINKVKPVLLNQTQWLTTKTDKNLQWWRKKQRVITKRKTARKRDRFKKQLAVVNKKLSALSKKVSTEKTNLYKTLYGNYDISDYILSNSTSLIDSNLLRKKQDNLNQSLNSNLTVASAKADMIEHQRDFQMLNLKIIKTFFDQNKFIENQKNKNVKKYKKFFSKKLRKKASSKGRRYRSLSLARYLTATRKPRLVGFENLTKMENLNNLDGSVLTKKEKQKRLNEILENKIYIIETLKKSQIKKRSRHSWKKRSRHQFNRNHYKYRKRHIHGNGKLRVMNKKLKKLKATYELRQWWWKSFLPRYLNNLRSFDVSNSGMQQHTDMTMANGLEQSSAKIFKQIETNNELKLTKNSIFSTNTAFKPLSNEQNTVDRLISNNILYTPKNSISDKTIKNVIEKASNNDSKLLETKAINNVNNIYLDKQETSKITLNKQPTGNYITTNLPFYAGWDESLRKFVVTNRLLSRRDAGLYVKNTTKTNSLQIAPIQGLNEGSFLYWQTDMPFNSYNIDQFITTNQSFYAPLGWRRFEFRHSILKTWTTQAQTLSTFNKNNTLIVSLKNLKNKNETSYNFSFNSITSKQTKKAAARRIKKRYKLLKQMPNQLMYAPTGPLLLEVLPSHYISVFDQQTRFPRNRYLKRNLLKTLKKTTLLTMLDSANQTNNFNKEFTFRKRVKPRRKYHRKRFIKKDGLIFPRRTKFVKNSLLLKNLTGFSTNIQVPEENLRWRPSSRSKQKRKETLKTKLNKRVKTNPLRLRQLRRREFQQIVKPLQRYIPRNGGFAWPGDYLRLEIVEMPKLKSNNVNKTSLKQKINVQPVGIMPRKYLIQKHNIKVLKKKLEKAYSSQQLSKAIKEYKFLIEKNI